MDQAEFKKAFDEFRKKPEQWRVRFNDKDWNETVKYWTDHYCNPIKNGLSLELWLKNEDGYLPDYLDTKEQNFGHSRIGNYDQVMIYQYSGKGKQGDEDKRKKGEYINVYDDKKKSNGDKPKIQKHYAEKIQPLLKTIVDAGSLEEVYKAEESDLYEKFSCKQILRKITILMSVMDGSSYRNEFAWFFNDKAINNLADLLSVDFGEDDTFLQKNNKVYAKAKTYSEIDDNKKDDIIALYNFLLALNDISHELADFKTPNIIFNGAPGTGKTFGVREGIRKLQLTNRDKYKDARYLQFHPSFSYEDFIEGIKPTGISSSGGVKLQIVNGAFKEFCIHVREKNEAYYKTLDKKPDPKKPSDFSEWPHYYFVVDEINRGNLSNIFGETFTLLESGYRDYDFSGNYREESEKLIMTASSSLISSLEDSDAKKKLAYKLVNEKAYFGIPFNVHFIGIMNDVDRSIDPFDLALRRRFKWIPKQCDYDALEAQLKSDGYDADSVKFFSESCEALNDYICTSEGLGLGKTYEIGHAFFMRISEFGSSKKITTRVKKELFSAYLEGTIKEYIRQAVDESEVDKKLKGAKTAFGI